MNSSKCKLIGTNNNINNYKSFDLNASNQLLKEHICIWNNLNFYLEQLKKSLNLTKDLKNELKNIFNELKNLNIKTLDDPPPYKLKIHELKKLIEAYKKSIINNQNDPKKINIKLSEIDVDNVITYIGDKFSEKELNELINKAKIKTTEINNLKKTEITKKDIPKVIFDAFYDTYINICEFFLFRLLHARVLSDYKDIILNVVNKDLKKKLHENIPSIIIKTLIET